jgi:prepilin-type N-terminal cleavage/methylation domain-containing protein
MKNKKSGFTLIEAIVVISLILSLTGLAYTNYVNPIFKKKESILVESELININLEISNNIKEGFAFLPGSWEVSSSSQGYVNKRTVLRRTSDTKYSIYILRYLNQVCSNNNLKYDIEVRDDSNNVLGILDSCTGETTLLI